MIAPSRRCHRRRQLNAAFTLIELMVAIVILSILMAVLLPLLSRAQRHGIEVSLNAGEAPRIVQSLTDPSLPPGPPELELPSARVGSFVGTIALTPRLSVGTAEPES